MWTNLGKTHEKNLLSFVVVFFFVRTVLSHTDKNCQNKGARTHFALVSSYGSGTVEGAGSREHKRACSRIQTWWFSVRFSQKHPGLGSIFSTSVTNCKMLGLQPIRRSNPIHNGYEKLHSLSLWNCFWHLGKNKSSDLCLCEWKWKKVLSGTCLPLTVHEETCHFTFYLPVWWSTLFGSDKKISTGTSRIIRKSNSK